MPLISNAGDVTFEADLEAVFETLQLQRSAQLTTTRDMQLASRLLVGAELRRLIARFGPDDPRNHFHSSHHRACRIGAVST